ncbi:hypothetical protein DL764_003577 [Monosporascus ibericus]|uniref:BRCT domain-containing protein n=1 Tax=Monosporascus ibericus TaxID=155417 RepID=A0A4Q4TJJ2_9PEZI|nr:hypothetical protein DL764_003577 [Monosporascus ibericus]
MPSQMGSLGDTLMPIGTGMHPSKRSDAGQIKGDSVPAPPAPERSLYAVTSYTWDDQYWLEGLQPPEVYASAAAANQAARGMMAWYAKVLNELGNSDEFDFQHNEDQECGDVGLYNGRLIWKEAHTAAEIRVFRVDGPEGTGEAREARGKTGRRTEGRVKVESVSDDGDGDGNADANDDDRNGNDDDEEEEENEGDAEPAPTRKRTLPQRSKAPTRSSTSATGSGKGKSKATTAPAKTAVQPSTYRKKIPEGKPNCLKGLKILFTGTFETMDRKTSIATAIKYGAEVITKLEDTDYIVVGLRAGPKKLQEISEKELETISEEEFFQILENGVGREKRERMAARRRADEEAHAGEESDADDAVRGKGRRKRARR